MVLRQVLTDALAAHHAGSASDHSLVEDTLHWQDAYPRRSRAHVATAFLKAKQTHGAGSKALQHAQQHQHHGAPAGRHGNQHPAPGKQTPDMKVPLDPIDQRIADLQAKLAMVKKEALESFQPSPPSPSKGAAIANYGASSASSTDTSGAAAKDGQRPSAEASSGPSAEASLAQDKQLGAAATSSDARPKRPLALGECHSEDGRYVVKVTPDGVRRLFDTSRDKIFIETRIQCDGEIPEGKQQGNCEDLMWPCPNIHRPFRGYMEDVIDQVKPFCQRPGWHALFVGLGGGYMQTTMSKMCAADGRIDTIEKSPGVLPIARNMFGFDDGKHHVEFGDGLEVMKNHSKAGDKYDFIFTDYGSENGKEFISTAHHLLKPGGHLAMSKTEANYDSNWLASLQDYFTPANPQESTEGNFTFVSTARSMPKGMAKSGKGTGESLTVELPAQPRLAEMPTKPVAQSSESAAAQADVSAAGAPKTGASKAADSPKADASKAAEVSAAEAPKDVASKAAEAPKADASEAEKVPTSKYQGGQVHAIGNKDALDTAIKAERADVAAAQAPKTGASKAAESPKADASKATEAPKAEASKEAGASKADASKAAAAPKAEAPKEVDASKAIAAKAAEASKEVAASKAVALKATEDPRYQKAEVEVSKEAEASKEMQSKLAAKDAIKVPLEQQEMPGADTDQELVHADDKEKAQSLALPVMDDEALAKQFKRVEKLVK